MKTTYYEIGLTTSSLSDVLFLKNNHLWYFFSQQKKSRFFGGFLFKDNQAFRFLDEIKLKNEITEIQILNPREAILVLKNNQIHFSLNFNSLELNFSFPEEISIHFDIKHIFENQPFKRKISLEKASSNTVIVNEFLEGYGLFKLLIEADFPLSLNNEWIEKKLNFDKERNSPPYSWYVYNGVSGKVRSIKIKLLSPELFQSEQEIFNSSQKPLINFLLSRINNLILSNYLPGGFPWFFENWYRDELLSLFLLKKFLKSDFLKQRLTSYLENLETIWDKNKNFSCLETSDTLLLLILNLDQDLFFNYFKVLEKFLSLWEQKFLKENELNLPDHSTWMDTLSRKKAIEILTLYFLSLKRLGVLNKEYAQKANYFKKKLKREILEKSDINILFSFIFAKELFSQKKWSEIFEKLLKKLYLEWGGLATLAKDNPFFKNIDDGEKSTAYHRGDSWYYLNNLAAVSLFQVNNKKFSKEIQQIIKSSLIDLFLDGALGFSSELSSAKERRSENSLVQLWSMASLVYLFSFFENVNIFLKSFSNSHNIISIKP